MSLVANSRILLSNGKSVGSWTFVQCSPICRYGDYQYYPEEPYVGSPAYPPKIYGSWDPNWRGFIGTTLIIAFEEYEHLLSEPTKDLILESLHNATKGDEYRVGGVDDDNLYPAYSNPVSPIESIRLGVS